ncbi:unnamed protein product [Phaedon cochleariae]|uniref:Cerebellar degeneration-related protein 2-like n=1 Tax=Phaedon cochleariae TaxID=80249 RepID=A0A9N9SLP8_PHACE|nr:unnamed protein product [Phaedon cochleariae]
MSDDSDGNTTLNSLDCWDYTIELECLQGTTDLQLAAELGKTLLERNKELETALKQHQVIIEDQAQEIEYLTKQTVALREVNDSRLRIYEQLEVSIQDLERANHRLVLDNSAEKKHVKSLNATVEALEAKCEELQSTIDDLNLQVDLVKRRNHRTSDVTQNAATREVIALRRVERSGDDEIFSPDSSVQSENKCSSTTSPTTTTPRHARDDPDRAADEHGAGAEQLAQLVEQLGRARAQCGREERRAGELEEQLATMARQCQALEEQLARAAHGGRGRDEEDLNMKSMHEELTTLEEVRQGQMCSRCLRSLDTSSEIPDDDDASMLDGLMATAHSHHRSSFSMDVQAHVDNQSSPLTPKQPANPYKELVQKYEALVEVHRKPMKNNAPSLQEEMQISGDFNPPSMKDTDEESGHGDSLTTEKSHKKTRKTFSTPTDFSEAETSSSGFADGDDTSNKFTQTEGRVGSFLCTIADGEDCKFSIYDDASPIDSRFRDRPEYRDLFKEIFNVLKKAAENKDEGEELPLLDDCAVKVPPVTPQADHVPDFLDDDSQSVVSSTMSELSTSQNEPTTVIENFIQSQNRPIPEHKGAETLLRPLVRQPLEYLSVEVRKRSSSRRKNKYSDRSDSPVTHIIGSPKINYSSRPNSGRKRREQSKNTSVETPEQNCWNGNTLQFWSSNRNVASPTPSQGSTKYEFRPSTASQDLHKLKKLDLSYAEVLRNADHTKRELTRQRRK